ncbi:MAG TPA: DoxX family protein [Candidatus Acidoferrales bacterium]|nr:DoxX family protein [Candidatus Acidoferrales bacterium]
MSNSSGSVVPLLGRILISVVFVLGGIGKITGFSMEEGMLAAKHFPMPAAALGVALVIELVGGLAILLGLFTRFTSWILFLYLIPTTLLFHNFWAFQGMDRLDPMIHFEKNLAIMGGLLILATYGAGAYSIDSSRAPKAA